VLHSLQVVGPVHASVKLAPSAMLQARPLAEAGVVCVWWRGCKWHVTQWGQRPGRAGNKASTCESHVHTHNVVVLGALALAADVGARAKLAKRANAVGGDGEDNPIRHSRICLLVSGRHTQAGTGSALAHSACVSAGRAGTLRAAGTERAQTHRRWGP
jgi:hypothetical protein